MSEQRFNVRYLPSDPATWPEYRKKLPTRAMRIDGPFTVETSEGPLRAPTATSPSTRAATRTPSRPTSSR